MFAEALLEATETSRTSTSSCARPACLRAARSFSHLFSDAMPSTCGSRAEAASAAATGEPLRVGVGTLRIAASNTLLLVSAPPVVTRLDVEEEPPAEAAAPEEEDAEEEADAGRADSHIAHAFALQGDARGRERGAPERHLSEQEQRKGGLQATMGT